MSFASAVRATGVNAPSFAISNTGQTGLAGVSRKMRCPHAITFAGDPLKIYSQVLCKIGSYGENATDPSQRRISWRVSRFKPVGESNALAGKGIRTPTTSELKSVCGLRPAGSQIALVGVFPAGPILQSVRTRSHQRHSYRETRYRSFLPKKEIPFVLLFRDFPLSRFCHRTSQTLQAARRSRRNERPRCRTSLTQQARPHRSCQVCE